MPELLGQADGHLGRGGARDHEGDPHARPLEQHLRRDPAGVQQDPVPGAHARQQRLADHLVNRIVAADVLGHEQQPVGRELAPWIPREEQ
jgi:hypothetical protein